MSKKEGFICPECMKNFGSLKILQDHFQQFHIDQTNLPNDSDGFIGILRKAKKTFEDIIDIKDEEINITNAIPIRNNVENVNCQIEQGISYAFYEEPNIKPQPNGIIVDRTQEFINFRRSRLLKSAIEMSSLILKIEKLISYEPNGSIRDRKSFEQSVVDWVKDDLVPMCPMCGGKFGINLPINTSVANPITLCSGSNNVPKRKTSKLKAAISNFMDMEIESSGLLIRKKHHCRICGCILCAHCSFMLSTPEARKLISAINSRFNTKESLLEESKGLLWKEDSQNSLDSVKLKPKSQDYSIRCCGNCKSQIEVKWNQIERRTCDHDIVDLYKELIEKINKVSSLLPEYEKMHRSLCLGETVYSYQRASELRSNIVFLCQEIDSAGNKFKSKTSTDGNERETTLVKSIYRNCFLFLQNNFATLKELPSETELERISQQKLMKIKKQADEERIIIEKKSPELAKYAIRKNVTDSGWAPTLTSNTSMMNQRQKVSSNPFECDESDSNQGDNAELSALALQIENVRQYIEMARQAKKFDEVKILQKNMSDLEMEYEALQKKNKI